MLSLIAGKYRERSIYTLAVILRLIFLDKTVIFNLPKSLPMILSWLTSAGNNIVEKTKNPFLGTFTLVWLARNWELVFALFNFDKAFTLDKKIEFLSERIQYDTFWTEVGWNVLWTFIVLILTYLLINIARVVSNLFEKRLTPIIYKWTDYKSLVPKSEYQGILTRMNDLQERLDKEIQERLKAQSERDEFEEKYNIELLEKNKNTTAGETITPLQSIKRETEHLNSDLFGGYSEEDLIYTLNLIKNKNTVWPNTRYEAIANKLYELHYLDSRNEVDNGTNYSLTQKGEDLINELNSNSSKDNNEEVETMEDFFHRIVNEYSYDTVSEFFVNSKKGYTIDKVKIKLLEYLIDELKDMGFILLKSIHEDSQTFKTTEKGLDFMNQFLRD